MPLSKEVVITFDDMSRINLFDMYMILSMVYNNGFGQNMLLICDDWKRLIKRKYMKMGRDDRCSIVYRGHECKLVLDISKIYIENYNDNAGLATKIVEIMGVEV